MKNYWLKYSLPLLLACLCLDILHTNEAYQFTTICLLVTDLSCTERAEIKYELKENNKNKVPWFVCRLDHHLQLG